MLGFFDSGFGGLSILKEILDAGAGAGVGVGASFGAGAGAGVCLRAGAVAGVKKTAREKSSLFDYDFVYLGDTARAPYGNYSPETIYRYTTEALEFLFKHGCDLVILVCFTASANALRKIQQEWLPTHFPDKKVLGVLIPTVEEVVSVSKNGRVGILGTRATINSGAVEAELKKRHPELQVFCKASPLLVPLIEEGWTRRPETKRILRFYLRPLKEKNIDTLILACTHYPILQKEIQAVIGKKVKVINPGQAEKKSLVDYLARHSEIEQKLSKAGGRKFYTTGRVEDFERLGGRFLGLPFKAEKAVL